MKRLYVLLVFVLFMATFASCGGNNGDLVEETPTPTPTATPTPTPTPEPEEPIAEESVEITLFEGPNWSMEIADGWVLLGTMGENFLIAPGESGSSIDVQVASLEGQSLDDVAVYVIDTFEALFEDFNLVADYFMEINGKDAILTVFETPSLGIHTSYQFIIEHGGIGYIVTFRRMDEEDFFDEVMEMLSTFTVHGDDITDSQLVGNWHMISSSDPMYTWGLDNDWEYGMYYSDDGTGFEWWYSPASGLHEMIAFEWSLSGNMRTSTLTDINFEIISYYLGEEFALFMESMIGTPLLATYRFENDNLIAVQAGITSVYQRN